MASITSPGIGSGLDVRGLVNGLVAAEGQPASNRLNRQELRLQSTLSALGSVKAALSSFQSAVAGLTNLNTFQKRTASSSHTELFTATAVGKPVAGRYEVEVKQLAQAHKLASAGFDGVDAVVGSGQLSFQFGDPSKPTRSVTIDANNNTLAGVRDAINAADIGVSASIINGDDGYQLVFSASGTGEANSLRIHVIDDDGDNLDNSGLSRLAFNEDAEQLIETSAARNAVVMIDGIQVTRSTNTITDAIAGVTLNLRKAEEGTKATLTLGLDKNSGAAAIEAFVNAYNEMVKSFNQMTAYNPETREAGVLNGDAAIRGIMGQLRAVMGNAIPGLEGGLRALADLGVRTERDGTLSLNKTTLSEAMDRDFDAVGRLFAASGLASHASVNFLGAAADTREGNYAIQITQLASRGRYEDLASSVSSLSVNAGNNGFRIQVDGVTSGSIALTEKTYASGAELAAELQSRINGDNTLRNAGVSVVVQYDSVNNRFSFTSERYGSASKVAFTELAANAADIGLSNTGSSEDGVDVAGTIGGLAATGSGQTLTGSGNAAGLRIEISGETLGDLGSVNFTRGVGVRLNESLDSLLGSNSFINARTGSIQSQIKGLDAQREALAKRLDALETRYMRQFTALDSMMAQMQATSNYLAGQLAALPGAYTGKK
ncbi:MAG: flagellar filament capping protein FliD [Gammaproteobacteria bacterium]|nr:flagellar filament capping protein FliD [Gammaproteobacteria bacterium]